MNQLADIRLLDLSAISSRGAPPAHGKPVCRWEIDPATRKPVRVWAVEPGSDPVDAAGRY